MDENKDISEVLEKNDVSEEMAEVNVADSTESGEKPVEVSDLQTDASIEEDVADMTAAGSAAVVVEESAAKKKKLPLWITLGVVALLGIAYGIGCWFYAGHFYGNTVYHGTWIGNQNADSAVETMSMEADRYTLSLTKQDDSKQIIKGKEIDFKFEDKKGIQKALDDQKIYDWPMHILGETTYKGSKNYSYDKNKLTKLLEPLLTIAEDKKIVSANATPVYKDGAVTIQKEVYGNVPDASKTTKLIKNALETGNTELDLKKEGCYPAPKFKSSDEAVKKAKTELEGKLKAEVTYTIDTAREVVDASVYGPWFKTDGEMKVYLDTNDAASYLSGLANQYDTAGGSYNFVTSSGSSITLNSGNYGWYIDEDAELPQLVANIENGDVVSREPASNGIGGPSANKSISGTYVEVSLDAQTMWLYVNGSCVISTPVVTGCVNAGHGTPSGVYYIHYHERNTSLVGSNDDGSTYNSPVSYWMPVNGGIGIHDADGWRSSYGGNIYIYDGSHGCINTPRSACGVIYENTSDGCPVVIY